VVENLIASKSLWVQTPEWEREKERENFLIIKFDKIKESFKATTVCTKNCWWLRIGGDDFKRKTELYFYGPSASLTSSLLEVTQWVAIARILYQNKALGIPKKIT
jgi:hypothetical protein